LGVKVVVFKKLLASGNTFLHAAIRFFSRLSTADANAAAKQANAIPPLIHHCSLVDAKYILGKLIHFTIQAYFIQNQESDPIQPTSGQHPSSA
jgi:hypothetical protein